MTLSQNIALKLLQAKRKSKSRVSVRNSRRKVNSVFSPQSLTAEPTPVNFGQVSLNTWDQALTQNLQTKRDQDVGNTNLRVKSGK